MKANDEIKVQYELEILPEHLDYRDEFDAETVEWIEEQINSGNEWAWFCAKVVALVEIDGERFKGADYLGGCSYLSREDFMAEGDYYSDMKAAALDDLCAQLRAARERGARAEVVLEELTKT